MFAFVVLLCAAVLAVDARHIRKTLVIDATIGAPDNFVSNGDRRNPAAMGDSDLPGAAKERIMVSSLPCTSASAPLWRGVNF